MAIEFINGVGVFAQVQRLNDFFFGGEGHLLGKYVSFDRFAILGYFTGVEVEVDELHQRKIRDVLYLIVPSPNGIEDAPAQADIDLHAGAAQGDKQGGVNLFTDRRGCRAGRLCTLVHLKLHEPLGLTDDLGVLIHKSGKAGQGRVVPPGIRV